MNTLNSTPYQTIKANAKKLEEIAQFYAETACSEGIEAGKTIGQESLIHRNNGHIFLGVAEHMTKESENLKGYLAARRSEDAAPAIDKKPR